MKQLLIILTIVFQFHAFANVKLERVGEEINKNLGEEKVFAFEFALKQKCTAMKEIEFTSIQQVRRVNTVYLNISMETNPLPFDKNKPLEKDCGSYRTKLLFSKVETEEDSNTMKRLPSWAGNKPVLQLKPGEYSVWVNEKYLGKMILTSSRNIEFEPSHGQRDQGLGFILDAPEIVLQ